MTPQAWISFSSAIFASNFCASSKSSRACLPQVALAGLRQMLRPQSFIIGPGFLIERFRRVWIDQLIDYADRTRGIEHMYGAGLIMRCDFYRGMRATRCCSTD